MIANSLARSASDKLSAFLNTGERRCNRMYNSNNALLVDIRSGFLVAVGLTMTVLRLSEDSNDEKREGGREREGEEGGGERGRYSRPE